MNLLRAILRIHRDRISARYPEAAVAVSLIRSFSWSLGENCSRPRSPPSLMVSAEQPEPLRNTNKQHLLAVARIHLCSCLCKYTLASSYRFNSLPDIRKNLNCFDFVPFEDYWKSKYQSKKSYSRLLNLRRLYWSSIDRNI